jgi:hypothetical protein
MSHVFDVLGERELLGVVVGAGLAEDLGQLAVLPFKDVAGGLALQADDIFRACHGPFLQKRVLEEILDR